MIFPLSSECLARKGEGGRQALRHPSRHPPQLQKCGWRRWTSCCTCGDEIFSGQRRLQQRLTGTHPRPQAQLPALGAGSLLSRGGGN